MIQGDFPRAPCNWDFLQSKLSLSVPNHLQNVYPSFGIANNVN